MASSIASSPPWPSSKKRTWLPSRKWIPAGLSVALAALFHERGGDARLTAAASEFYIEVIP